MADRPISEFSTYSPTTVGQMLVLDTTTSTTKRMLVQDLASYVLNDIISTIDGGDNTTVFLDSQDIDGGTATA